MSPHEHDHHHGHGYEHNHAPKIKNGRPNLGDWLLYGLLVFDLTAFSLITLGFSNGTLSGDKAAVGVMGLFLINALVGGVVMANVDPSLRRRSRSR